MHDGAFQPQSGRVSRELSLTVEKDILRGAGLETVLTRFGHAFKSGVTNAHVEASDFLKSKEVASLDDFISHDWASGRIQKTLALLMIYNSQAAMLSSIFVGMCLCALQSIDVLPFYGHRLGHGMWCVFLCPLVFVVTLLSWQDVRAVCRMGTRKVFLDKYCINQKNPEKKKQGILGLGGFLNATERLVICWTPRYFTRLWCVFEIATWLYLDKDFNHIIMMPLATSSLLFAILAFAQTLAIALHLLSAAEATAGINANNYAVAALAVLAPIAGHTCRRLENDLKQLPQQVRDFSITKAACYCCTVQHKAPGTGEGISCDRDLVYQTLQRWFPMADDSDDSSQMKLSMFDMEIKSLFETFILRRAGPSTFQYKHAMLVGLPFIWRGLDVGAGFGASHIESADAFRIIVEYLTVGFCVVPSLIKLMMHVAVVFDRYVGIPAKRYKDVLMSIACGFLFLVMVSFLWGTVSLFSKQKDTVGICISCAVWTFIVTPVCYRESMPCMVRRASQVSSARRASRAVFSQTLSDMSSQVPEPVHSFISSETKSEDSEVLTV
eukprot:TRINITY_DN67162_c0_g1_i1.p1 TRINITY_DN67162_c0_g1~~TRINITY_DN67162_c0_g1_i1.p1  ORF type:complete len:553 (-),score=55.89 TRINITY_DN67162_c0_g1_i1:184-1842(-)